MPSSLPSSGPLTISTPATSTRQPVVSRRSMSSSAVRPDSRPCWDMPGCSTPSPERRRRSVPGSHPSRPTSNPAPVTGRPEMRRSSGSGTQPGPFPTTAWVQRVEWLRSPRRLTRPANPGWRCCFRSSRRSPPSTAWRCAAAIPPGSRSPSGTTASTWPTRRSRRIWPHARPTRSCAREVPGCSPGPGWCWSSRRPPRSGSWVTTHRRCAVRWSATNS